MISFDQPCSFRDLSHRVSFTTGLLYIAAYVEKEGHQVVVRDLAVRKKKEGMI